MLLAHSLLLIIIKVIVVAIIILLVTIIIIVLIVITIVAKIVKFSCLSAGNSDSVVRSIYIVGDTNN